MFTSFWFCDPYLEAVLAHLALRNNLNLYINHVINNSNCSHLTLVGYCLGSTRLRSYGTKKGNKVLGREVNHNKLSRGTWF